MLLPILKSEKKGANLHNIHLFHENFKITISCFVWDWSCKKTEKTSVKVTVIDKNTQHGIANKKITLFEAKAEKRLIGSARYNSHILKEAYTDANGQVDFGEFDTHRNNNYIYYVNGSTENPNVKKGENNNIIFSFTGYVMMAVKFTPPPPYNSDDSLSVSVTKPSGYKYSIITNYNYTGSQFNFGLESGYKYINIDKYKSGIYTNIKDTVFYLDGATNEYDVNW